jgi:hypothetical protein
MRRSERPPMCVQRVMVLFFPSDRHGCDHHPPAERDHHVPRGWLDAGDEMAIVLRRGQRHHGKPADHTSWQAHSLLNTPEGLIGPKPPPT